MRIQRFAVVNAVLHRVDTIEADTLIGDKGFDADARVVFNAGVKGAVLASRGKEAVILPRKTQKSRTQPAFYDTEKYKKRHKIENTFSRLKDNRGIATRYDKTARCFLWGVYLAAAMTGVPPIRFAWIGRRPVRKTTTGTSP